MIRRIPILITIILCFTIYTQAQYSDTLRVYYDINKSILNTSQQAQIDQFILKIKQLKIVKININGYTDYLASDAYNKALSAKRANNVRDYLYKKGITNLIRSTEGKGKLPPTLSNSNEGLQANRKVEIIVIYKHKETSKPKEKTNTKEPKTENKTDKTIEKEPQTETIIETTNAIKSDTANNTSQDDLAELINETDIGKNIILKNVNFYPGRHFPMEEARPALEELVKVLKDNPKLEIEIQGHICCVPYEHDCLDLDTRKNNLSKERAKYVYLYLIRNGINKSRLKHKGYGARYKIYKDEIDEEERMQNRRVEIKILNK